MMKIKDFRLYMKRLVGEKILKYNLLNLLNLLLFIFKTKYEIRYIMFIFVFEIYSSRA